MIVEEQDLKRFQKTADINEIAMMFGRYVTLMDQMDAWSVYEEMFACDSADVSVEFDTCGTYIGPEHVRAFMQDLSKKLENWRDKRGWMDFHDGATPEIVISQDGTRAQAMWSLFSPKAKPATPESGVTSQRTLVAFWQAGKMHWELVRINGNWKILHFHLLTYFTTPYHSGWLKQTECRREKPFWAMKPDRRPRFYVYHPDQVYVKGGQYTWGPYLPDEGTF